VRQIRGLASRFICPAACACSPAPRNKRGASDSHQTILSPLVTLCVACSPLQPSARLISALLQLFISMFPFISDTEHSGPEKNGSRTLRS
jgi:hypothetical protein